MTYPTRAHFWWEYLDSCSHPPKRVGTMITQPETEKYTIIAVCLDVVESTFAFDRVRLRKI